MKKNIYTGKYVTLFLEQEGDKNREKVYLKDSVNLLLIDEGHNLFLINEPRWENDNWKKIKLLSGLVEDNEKASSAAKRELLEETGITGAKLKKLFTYKDRGTINQDKHYFIAYIKNSRISSFDRLCKFTERSLQRKIRKNFFGLSTTGALLRMFQKIKRYE
jgi:ADP-ribose pyrophosphatase YjhB (NUDIX family)